MPVVDNGKTHSGDSSLNGALRRATPITIGFVNNMPDAALRTTERQFRELLSAASGNSAVNIRFFSLPDLPRSEAGRLHVSQNYEDIAELWESHFDGLIVTGTEPRAQDLTDEPYWDSLAKLVEWAEDHAASTVWSCLAAHAAVLELDGISRQPLPQKLSGVFDCFSSVSHPILAGTPSRWRVPHSRHNELPEEALTAKGYSILSRSPEAGADIFIKHRKGLFVFVQGHPEYDPEALLREFRRDVGRFLSGERDSYPEMPHNYFDEDTAKKLDFFRQRALHERDSELLNAFPVSNGESKLAHPWRETAVRIYANWLSILSSSKTQELWPAEIVEISDRA